MTGAGRAGLVGCSLPCRAGAFGWLLFVSEASISYQLPGGERRGKNLRRLNRNRVNSNLCRSVMWLVQKGKSIRRLTTPSPPGKNHEVRLAVQQDNPTTAYKEGRVSINSKIYFKC